MIRSSSSTNIANQHHATHALQQPVTGATTAPVPTAKRSRNAANEPLRHYLDSTIQDPANELLLPDAHMPTAMRNPALPSVIDYQKLKGGTMNSVLRRSAKAFGAFGIRGHGISGQDLRLMANEARRLAMVMVMKHCDNIHANRNAAM